MLNYGTRRRMATGSDEAEALQTDVMRFLAIICMCLMIVFSLVQSLPVTEENNQPKMVDKKMLEIEVDILQERADELTKILDVLEQDIRQYQSRIEQNKEKIKQQAAQNKELNALTQKTADMLKKKLAALSAIESITQSAREKEKDAREKIRSAAAALKSKESSLERISVLIQKGARELSSMDLAITKAKMEMRKLREVPEKPPVKELKQAPQPVPQEEKVEPAAAEPLTEEPIREEPLKEYVVPPETGTAASKTQIVEASMPRPVEREGFTLGFASNDALMRLLKRGDVRFFVFLKDNYWKLKITPSGLLSFESSVAPGKIYEMDRRTVPDNIVKASRRKIAAFGRGSVTFGVALPADITAQFQGLMTGRKGGDIVIGANGTVTLD